MYVGPSLAGGGEGGGPSKNSLTLRKGVEIIVLGTHFNINAYNDEPTINTTLLEGSVKVNYGIVSKILTPGQQLIAIK